MLNKNSININDNIIPEYLIGKEFKDTNNIDCNENSNNIQEKKDKGDYFEIENIEDFRVRKIDEEIKSIT
jgi:hypothetical protein